MTVRNSTDYMQCANSKSKTTNVRILKMSGLFHIHLIKCQRRVIMGSMYSEAESYEKVQEKFTLTIQFGMDRPQTQFKAVVGYKNSN